jgi:hypothetical protein
MSRIENMQPKNKMPEKVAVSSESKPENMLVEGDKKLEAVEAAFFNQAFEKAITIEESRKRTLQHIDELWQSK